MQMVIEQDNEQELNLLFYIDICKIYSSSLP
jgi:hypothetical protein